MEHGAEGVYHIICKSLEDYLETQYFGKIPFLADAVSDKLREEGNIRQKPYLEASPVYKKWTKGFGSIGLPKWESDFFTQLSEKNLGVYKTPYEHQIKALRAAEAGKDVFVYTGTGSGKTECFFWPIIAKLVKEAHETPETWKMRGARVIIMYPMNALVSDQISRLRRILGDPEGNFVRIFRSASSQSSRRPRFGMYTGRTPYPGHPDPTQDHHLSRTLAKFMKPADEKDQKLYFELLEKGRIPAKKDLNSFLQRVQQGIYTPDPEDAELITRFEIQNNCPDILITNYSMLEYMLMRPIEKDIWADTKKWLESSPENRLLFVIDEAHMYRGASGGEVALLLRRMMYRLGVGRERLQFILTTASIPDSTQEQKNCAHQFAQQLTAAEEATFEYITGVPEQLSGKMKYSIPNKKFLSCSIERMEGSKAERLAELNRFWIGISNSAAPFHTLSTATSWMYDHLAEYEPFYKMLKLCRGKANALDTLASVIFPELSIEQSKQAVSALLEIAPLAKNTEGSVLFPVRMHLLFRGIEGVYACTGDHCKHPHSDGKISLGNILIHNNRLTCPDCGSMVYELLNDRRCGALFLKGYALREDIEDGAKTYLWHDQGSIIKNLETENEVIEVHLYLPQGNNSIHTGSGKYSAKPCYLDTRSGYLEFDDTDAEKPCFRKLYYCLHESKGRPNLLSFSKCPKCGRDFKYRIPTSFATKGNEPFFNLIKAQFSAEPSVPGKDSDPVRFPNEGRKELLFSDSRQRAATLARDLTEASEETAVRQLFMLAARDAEEEDDEVSLDRVYGYFVLEAMKRHIAFPDWQGFYDNTEKVKRRKVIADKNGLHFRPKLTFSDAPRQMRKWLLRLFCGGFNTLEDMGLCWLQPTDDTLYEIIEETGCSQDDVLELFHTFLLYAFDRYALGDTISDDIREEITLPHSGFGLPRGDYFSQKAREVMGWKKNSREAIRWTDAFQDTFLCRKSEDLNGNYYIKLDSVKPCTDPKHRWYRCKECGLITSLLLKKKCPVCASKNVVPVAQHDFELLSFWRDPVEAVWKDPDKPIRLIDTEEHTAQLSYKDQRNAMWSKTEQYEMRFQDLVGTSEEEDSSSDKGNPLNQPPVDILSSTTTMEVGIDIGSLVAIGLRNIPPTRENYQQRAGRAGRRGTGLSTIVTYCQDGPYDNRYFSDPKPMLCGDARTPWIDISSEKLLRRHLSMLMLQKYLESINTSMDEISAINFLDNHLNQFLAFVKRCPLECSSVILPKKKQVVWSNFLPDLEKKLRKLKVKREQHTELYATDLYNRKNGCMERKEKKLLDALYEEGIIPTYSFPKDVVSAYVTKEYRPQRALNIAISEYAPGRTIVVDKQTYQIGGLYAPGAEYRNEFTKHYFDDKNYNVELVKCPNCDWFGTKRDLKQNVCPFCGSNLSDEDPWPNMIRPWGFAPLNAQPVSSGQFIEQYSSAIPPMYSDLPKGDMQPVAKCKHIRKAIRSDQNIIMLNRGPLNKGYTFCPDCGAMMPGDDPQKALKGVKQPYYSKYSCKHTNAEVVNLGFQFRTDMLVLEFTLDPTKISTDLKENLWLKRASISLSEALHLTAGKMLDVELLELEAGSRIRKTKGGCFVDIYLYDSLSSGAGYSAHVADDLPGLLHETICFLEGCTCERACFNCLKRYGNQRIHDSLDRHAAVELLRWGINGEIKSGYSTKQQITLLKPLTEILSEYEIRLETNMSGILLNRRGIKKRLVIYPAMWSEPQSTSDKFYVSDFAVKEARPYAVDKIRNQFA
jgi:ATP-dependent helicase YprA (DUF1998 family)/rRNA maturation protein Nop10